MNKMHDDQFAKLENTYLNSYNYMQRIGDIEEIKKIALDDEICQGFSSDGLLKFFIDFSKTEYREGSDLYYIKDRVENTTIPKKIHFIWFKGGRPFNIVNYIAIKSAIFHNPKYQVYLHCDEEPNNIYYKNIKNKITINKIEEPKNLNNHEINTYQHKADYVRLNVLYEMGGIYLDTDFISLKTFEDLLKHSFVMGYERAWSTEYICNCVIMTKSKNKIIKEWIHIYNNSWGENFIANWIGHSVMIPSQLKSKYNDEMTILTSNCFFPFLWDDLSILHDDDNGKTYNESYGVHLWDTEASKTNLLPEDNFYFENKNNAFVRLFKKHLDDFHQEDEDFLIYKGYDSGGYDIEYHYKKTIEELKELCINNPNCVGFNTIGFLKSKIDINNLTKFSGIKFDNCRNDDSIYIYKKRYVSCE